MNLPPFKLERYFAQYEFRIEHLLCASDCETVSIGELLALEPGAESAFRSIGLGYTESSGSPGLRREISRIYTTIDPDEVLVLSGAEEGIFLLMHAVLAAEDHVIIHQPAYQSLGEVARSIGCETVGWRGSPGNGWALDLQELEDTLRPDTRMVVINFPHNPTGYLMSLDRFRELVEITDRRGLLLFSDEVYRELEYRPEDRLPAACDLSDTAVSLGVMSKTYGLAGLRIGWIATHNDRIRERMAALKDYTTICSSAPGEYLSELALRHRERISARNLDIIRRNLTILDGFFAGHQELFEWHRPDAGSVAFPRLRGPEVDDFCHRLVTEAGVLLLPGSLFEERGNHFRIGFGRRNMESAVDKLDEFVARRI